MSLYEKLKREAKSVKQRQETRQSGQFEKIDWFKPQVGDNRIRFLPHPTKPDSMNPWHVVRLHFISKRKNDGSMVQGIPVRCLQDFKEECPLCDAFERMVKTDKDKAKSLRANERYLYNILCYDTRKVQPFAAGVMIHEELMGWFEEIDANVFDLKEGYDWKLVKTQKPGASKLTGTRYRLRPGTKPSAIPEKMQPMLEAAMDLTTLYAANDKKAMLEFLGEDDDEEKLTEDDFDSEDDSSKRSIFKAKTAAAKVKRSKDEDFEEDEDEEEEERPKKAKKKIEEDFEDEEEDEEEPRAKVKLKAKAKKKVDEEDEDYSDPDLERELRELGV